MPRPQRKLAGVEEYWDAANGDCVSNALPGERVAGRHQAEVRARVEFNRTVRTTTSKDGKIAPADGGAPIFGMKLSSDLTINSKEGLKAAVDALTYATSQLRAAYREISGQNEGSQTGPGKTGGTVPTYMTNQLANYQAALARLGGG